MQPLATPARVWLHFGDRDVVLPEGETIVGRSPKCPVCLDDAMVSRQHARIVNHRGAVTVEDLGSVNGVLVNGVRLVRARVLLPGDHVVIGSQTLELRSSVAGSVPPRRDRAMAQTLTGAALPDAFGEVEKTEATHRNDLINMLGSVVEKVLALGRADEAERILSGYLRSLLQGAKVSRVLDAGVAEKAAMYAVRIAEATGKSTWADYAFELYTILGRPLPAPIVDRLYGCVRKLAPSPSLTIWRAYLAALRSAEGEFGPSDRFLVRRLEGLEPLFGAR